MFKGRVAQAALALTRLERIVEKPIRDEIQAYDEPRGRRNADASLRAARMARQGRGPRRTRDDD